MCMYKISVWMVTLKSLNHDRNSVENESIFLSKLNRANKKSEIENSLTLLILLQLVSLVANVVGVRV